MGFSLGLCIYLVTMQRHFFLSKRYLAYGLLIAAAGMVVSACLNEFVLRRRVEKQSQGMRAAALVFSVLMGLIALANTRGQPLYYLLPDTKLEMLIPIGELPEGQENVQLSWIHTGQDYVHYTALDIEGEWERVEKNIVFAPEQEVRISWEGKVGAEPEVGFRLTRYDQPVYVAWNGDWQEYNLYSDSIDPEEPNLLIRDELQVPLLNRVPFMLSFTILAGYLIFIALMVLGTWQPEKKQAGRGGKYAWLLYMLPMVICWGFTLLVFWPGFMTNDSMAQWVQGVTGIFQDWHSAFHAFLIALLMKLWYSPAIVAIIQIIALALLVAWGLKILEENGVSKIITWLICFLFASLPTNNVLMATIWKDIPYAISFLWLSILLLSIFLSEGNWIEKKYNWLVLGLAGFFVAIFRKNGVSVAFASLLFLPFFYRPQLKKYLKSFLLLCLLYGLVKGPLYSVMHVDRDVSGQSNLILLHHIAAHWDEGTSFTPEEETYLNSILPLAEWDYSCCYMGPVYFHSGFKQDEFLKNTRENIQLALNLFKRNPGVDIKHMFCAGEIVWKYGNAQCYMKSTQGFYSIEDDNIEWIIPNDVGLKENSQFPDLVKPYIENLRKFGFFDNRLVFYLTPAFNLYLVLFCAMVSVIRFNNWKAWIFCLPVLSQSVALFFINFVPAFRYLYSNLLVGAFFEGLLFIPSKTRK